MKKITTTLLLLVVTGMATAQETHYHRALRTDQDKGYGLLHYPTNFGSGHSGYYWSRTRDVNDVAIVTDETHEDSIARVRAFGRLCGQAYDAYEARDYYHTIVYGDSALAKRFHTPDLYYFMGVSFEALGDYQNAEWGFKMAMRSGYTKVPDAYPAFKARMKQRKQEEKQRKKEEKKNRKNT